MPQLFQVFTPVCPQRLGVLHGFRGAVLDRSFFLCRTERLLQGNRASRTLRLASNPLSGFAGNEARPNVVTVKASQKIFTDAEVATLTGICVEHVHNFAKSRHLGFIARAAERAGIQADQWLFTLSDLMVLVTLFPKCTH